MAHEPMPEAVKGKKGTRRPPPAKTPVLRFNQPAKYEELDSIQPPLSETMTMREGVSMTQDGSLSSGALPSTAEPLPQPHPRTHPPTHPRPRAPTPSTHNTCSAPPPPPRGEPSCSPLRRPSLSPPPAALHSLPGPCARNQTEPASRPPRLATPGRPGSCRDPCAVEEGFRVVRADGEPRRGHGSRPFQPSGQSAGAIDAAAGNPACGLRGLRRCRGSRRDAADDINLQLMAKDWGVNPPQREVNAANKPRYKPNTTQTLGVGRARLPRERGGTGVAEHLPPPLLPATAGWGLGATYGGIPEEHGGGPPPPSGNAGSPIRTANPQLRQQVLGQ